MRRTTIAWASIAGLVAPLGAQEVIGLPAEDRYLEADFEEVFRVGTAVADPRENFTTIAGLAFDEEGNLYVFDGRRVGGGPEAAAVLSNVPARTRTWGLLPGSRSKGDANQGKKSCKSNWDWMICRSCR